MKKESLLLVLMLGISLHAYGNNNQAQGLKNGTTGNSKQLENCTANSSKEVSQDKNNAVSGVKSLELKESKASKRLNRQFRSKRPYINYQFN